MNPEIPQNNIPSAEEYRDYRELIRRVAGGADVRLNNEEQFSKGESRFLYGFTENTDHSRGGFIKLAKIDDRGLHTQLRRESLAMEVASGIGISTVRQWERYTEFPEGFAVVHYEKLSAENGEVLGDDESVASARPEFGTWAGEALFAASGKEIPAGVDTEIFKKGDWRSQSSETFWKVYEESEAGVLNLSPEKQKLLSAEQIDFIRSAVSEVKPGLQAMIDGANSEEKYFFVHNDASPSNTFFDSSKGKATLLDFEHAGVTHNAVLARLTDFQNFYARSWPNPEMQKQFINSILEQGDAKNVDDLYVTAKTTIIFGTLYLAKYAMNPEHREHLMAKTLLTSLPSQLENLEETYAKRKEELS